ncbi:hypothetical protein BUALT_Bualt01G0142900 [Buddleja alternifolia]|uniref:DUF8040 domain-containing protein n=1 Tax=Buddleja alternifolia TaxID=168488 RepID=A0AAV6Y824_9LAMI|nr:hypothetical protein BUALT_Bualt01G0142900 [Buddleja alternifolia]
MHQNMFILNMFVRHMHNNGGRCRETEKLIRYVMAHRIPKQIEHLECLIELNDVDCIDNLRMSRVAFARLCYLLEHIGGLVNSRYVTVKEKVALFLSILAHHKKIRIVHFDFKRSGQTVSNHFHAVLNAVLSSTVYFSSPLDLLVMIVPTRDGNGLSYLIMSNNKIDCYFKKRCSQDSTSSPVLETSSTVISEASKLSDDQTSIPESSPTKVRKLDQDSNCLNSERDPGLRIWFIK